MMPELAGKFKPIDSANLLDSWAERRDRWSGPLTIQAFGWGGRV